MKTKYKITVPKIQFFIFILISQPCLSETISKECIFIKHSGVAKGALELQTSRKFPKFQFLLSSYVSINVYFALGWFKILSVVNYLPFSLSFESMASSKRKIRVHFLCPFEVPRRFPFNDHHFRFKSTKIVLSNQTIFMSTCASHI